MASWTSPRVSASTLPISRVMSRANRSLRSRGSAPPEEDLRALRRGHEAPRGIRALAAATAASTSAVVDSGTGRSGPGLGGIAVLERRPRLRGHPLSVDVVAKNVISPDSISEVFYFLSLFRVAVYVYFCREINISVWHGKCIDFTQET